MTSITEPRAHADCPTCRCNQVKINPAKQHRCQYGDADPDTGSLRPETLLSDPRRTYCANRARDSLPWFNYKTKEYEADAWVCGIHLGTMLADKHRRDRANGG